MKSVATNLLTLIDAGLSVGLTRPDDRIDLPGWRASVTFRRERRTHLLIVEIPSISPGAPRRAADNHSQTAWYAP